MKITIITSCYNREETVACAVKSVLAQDYPDIEYIIVDGASTDGSRRVIEETIRGHSNVKYISEPDNGMYEAINKGIRMATGDVIGLMHSDDFFYDSQVVSRIAELMEQSGADFLYGDGLFVDAVHTDKVVRKWIGGIYSKWKVRHGWLPLHPTCYIRRSVYDKYGLYDEMFKIAADTDFLVRTLISAKLKVVYLKNYVVMMRMGGLSTDSARRKQMWEEDIMVYRRYVRFPTITKIEKMMWKVPQFVKAVFM